MNQTQEIKLLVSEWLIGMVLASFSFAAGFTLRFERNELSSEKPNVLYLEIKSSAYVGAAEDWDKFKRSLPCMVRRGEKDDPALAYRIALLIGSSVELVKIYKDGLLSIGTTDLETLFVCGIDKVWDDSWILRESLDIAEDRAISIICDSEGNISIS